MHLSPESVRALRYPSTGGAPVYGAATTPRIRVPSVRMLASIPWLDKLHNDPTEVARAVRRVLLDAARDPANYRPGGFSAWEARNVLRALDLVLETYGVETLALDAQSDGTRAMPRVYYLNAGDTYAPTLLFHVPSRQWRVTSWGDVVEREERRGIRYT